MSPALRRVLHTALDTQVASDLHPRPLAQILSKARFLWPNLGDLIVGGGEKILICILLRHVITRFCWNSPQTSAATRAKESDLLKNVYKGKKSCTIC
jgi:hypothetical protein